MGVGVQAGGLRLSCWLSQASSQHWAVSQGPGMRRAGASPGPCELRHLPEPARQATFLTGLLIPSARPGAARVDERSTATLSLGSRSLPEGTFLLGKLSSEQANTSLASAQSQAKGLPGGRRACGGL